ncbi:helix-turn-helix transcriptional regulator [Streptomyces kunmingensis]|uniref:Helix-turn-helix transcriptional regulator n=1 Tax=Streptomyces kunmingensis TaxID=68225 RepID=A0ABU6CEU8_9ACTN|nr:helix-turn-helix transcriptional regulator [Streptomyces kunmingensis]MEB3962989.1 helix-turn-helix transcriptional regulator [Streptomyces kunmingensis]
MHQEAVLGQFLRSRRQAARPAPEQLISSGARQVPGLRREEVAAKAGVSVDYYTRLEQGRKNAPSEEVLSAIALALGMSLVERQHLFDLARATRPLRRSSPAQSARPGLMNLMETIGDIPAVLHGRGTDILAVNEAARAVIADFYAKPSRERNIARWFFLDKESRIFEDWENVAAHVAGMLRLDFGRHPGDRRLQSLVAELNSQSSDFRRLWTLHYVAVDFPRRKLINHPAVGSLRFDMEEVSPKADRDQTLDIFMPRDTQTKSAVARLLASRRTGAAETASPALALPEQWE